jgi:hypothetical protein
MLQENKQIRDTTIMPRIRSSIEQNYQWEQTQDVLIQHLKRDVNNSFILSDSRYLQ